MCVTPVIERNIRGKQPNRIVDCPEEGVADLTRDFLIAFRLTYRGTNINTARARTPDFRLQKSISSILSVPAQPPPTQSIKPPLLQVPRPWLRLADRKRV